MIRSVSDTQAVASEPHPLAGTPMTGAEMVVEVLADEGVDVVFGYSGGAILPGYDAIFRRNAQVAENQREGHIELVVPANEQAAGFMAAGYSRASGDVGVVMVTSGPGATNTVTPIRDSMADSVPLVVICGQVPTAAIGTDAFQEAPVAAIMGAVAKHVFLVTDAVQLEATLRSAFEIARSGRPGPVVIDIPKDVQNWEGPFNGDGQLPLPGFRKRLDEVTGNQLRQEQCEEFYRLLSGSERPLIYAGGGVINADAAAALRAFSHEFKIPVTTTLMGIGAIDTSDPLCLHMLGMHGTAYANYAVDDCDFLIAVGSRFDDRVAGVPGKFAPNARHIAHFDVDPSEIGKVKKVDWAHIGILKRDLDDLLEYGRRINFAKGFDSWLDHVRDLKRTHAMNYDRDSKVIQPHLIIETINALTKGQAIVSTGVGQHQMWAAQYFDFAEPRHWLTSGSMGTMGFGLPAAAGAQFACPDRLVIDIDGDASIRMNIGELETLTTYNLPVKVVVLNNLGDGMVKQWQKTFFGGRMSGSDKTLHSKNFVMAAKADGFGFAERLSNVEKIEQTIKAFIEFDGPAFLEVMIDTQAMVYPMVGPGQSYKDMQTGDHIVSRETTSIAEIDPTGMF